MGNSQLTLVAVVFPAATRVVAMGFSQLTQEIFWFFLGFFSC